MRYIILAFVTSLSLFKFEANPLIDFKEIAGRYVVWDVFLLVLINYIFYEARELLQQSRTTCERQPPPH